METPCWINCPVLRLKKDDRHLVCLMDQLALMRDLSDGQLAHFAHLIEANAKEMVGGAHCRHTIEAIQEKAYFLGRSN